MTTKEMESTRRDVQIAMQIQEREEWRTEDWLANSLQNHFGWNLIHAKEIAELAWIQLYAEKEE